METINVAAQNEVQAEVIVSTLNPVQEETQMNALDNNGPEEAAQTTPTQEDIAETSMNSMEGEQSSVSTSEQFEDSVEIKPIDPEVVNELREMFEEAVASPVFMSKITGVAALKVALKIRPSDDPAYNMCYSRAEEKLLADAARSAHRAKLPVIYPTEAAITELANKNYEKNKENKAKKVTPSGAIINN